MYCIWSQLKSTELFLKRSTKTWRKLEEVWTWWTWTIYTTEIDRQTRIRFWNAAMTTKQNIFFLDKKVIMWRDSGRNCCALAQTECVKRVDPAHIVASLVKVGQTGRSLTGTCGSAERRSWVIQSKTGELADRRRSGLGVWSWVGGSHRIIEITATTWD